MFNDLLMKNIIISNKYNLFSLILLFPAINLYKSKVFFIIISNDSLSKEGEFSLILFIQFLL